MDQAALALPLVCWPQPSNSNSKSKSKSTASSRHDRSAFLAVLATCRPGKQTDGRPASTSAIVSSQREPDRL